ncbi:caspase family protein [Aliiruegeria lutimaris]|uniref:Caspase domain-containing protein n=1 Tax=Aliiruegeria lutimaris TaxID=571298 RepID=A0A1G8T732_9RHOB|nr:caspase family protein [Aliiruegeria lutimaris]SDJ37191.1 Caspase domain-containing protein [Aliiruegeria lutimaris]
MIPLIVPILRLFLAVTAFQALVTTAIAEPRLALVVGNESYMSVSPLDNPASDARLVAAALTSKGFEVTLLTDADQVRLNRAIAQFGRDLRANGAETTGLFYYAGHAVQSFGANYLLPVDVLLTDAADLGLVAVRADAILRQMASARNHANLVILDACRNNPFVDVPDMNDNGLAEMKAPTGTFMAYSTAPGSVAMDGVGSNSPFTSALVTEMDSPGLPVEQAFKRVRSKVLEATNGRQTPWDTSSLTVDFQFTPALQEKPEQLAADEFFESIRASGDPVQIVLFLRTYPESEHFDAARELLTQALDGEQEPEAEKTAAAAPASAPPSDADAREREMIEAAQISGRIEEYRAYLDAFPTGVFAELATMEMAALAAKGAEPQTVARQPSQVETPPVTPTAPGDVTLEALLAHGDPVLNGKSIAMLVDSSPLFPPIPGLPEGVWKNRPCASCHEWTAEALCDQAKTYLADAGTRALSKQHPFGGGFKDVLRNWAGGGCR